MIKILSLALLPVVVLIIFILLKDRERPEPVGKLLKALFMGALSVVVVLMIVPVIELCVDMSPHTLTGQINTAFWGAAIPEEAVKLFMLWLVLRKNPYFDEYFDGIVYAVMVGLGFAGIENIMYLFNYSDEWVSVGIMRALMSVPGHYAFAVFMGYFYSLAHFNGNVAWLNYIAAFVVPMVIHGLYDMLLMVSSITPDFVSTILVIGCYVLCYYMHKAAIKRIKRHLQSDKTHIEEYNSDTEAYKNDENV